jgi:hypothetical protein
MKNENLAVGLEFAELEVKDRVGFRIALMNRKNSQCMPQSRVGLCEGTTVVFTKRLNFCTKSYLRRGGANIVGIA